MVFPHQSAQNNNAVIFHMSNIHWIHFIAVLRKNHNLLQCEIWILKLMCVQGLCSSYFIFADFWVELLATKTENSSRGKYRVLC